MSFRAIPVLALALLVAAPGLVRAEGPTSLSFSEILAAAGDLTIPSAWAGVWAMSDTTRICGTSTVTETWSGVDTLCTGGTIVEPEGAGSFDCTGTVSDTVLDIECSGSSPFPPDCMIEITLSLDATRSGNSVTATETTSITYSGGVTCNILPDTCLTTTTNGTRTGPEPAECANPVEPSTWGRVKAGYR